MNEQETNTAETVQVAAKKRGRPLDMTATRVLRVNPETGKAYGKGRILAGTPVLLVTVHRQINSDNYIHGTTPVVASENAVVINTQKPKAAKPSNVQLHVIEPSAPVEDVSVPVAAVEIPA